MDTSLYLLQYHGLRQASSELCDFVVATLNVCHVIDLFCACAGAYC